MEFPCQSCGGTLRASDDVIGRYVICVHCERPNVVPDPPPLLLKDVSLADVLAEAHCPYCGYLLKGLAENRCPECGRRFDPLRVIRRGDRRERQKLADKMFVAGMAAGAVLAVALLSLCGGLWSR